MTIRLTVRLTIKFVRLPADLGPVNLNETREHVEEAALAFAWCAQFEILEDQKEIQCVDVRKQALQIFDRVVAGHLSVHLQIGGVQQVADHFAGQPTQIVDDQILCVQVGVLQTKNFAQLHELHAQLLDVLVLRKQVDLVTNQVHKFAV